MHMIAHKRMQIYLFLLFLTGIASPATLFASDKAMTAQQEAPFDRIINRFSSARETIMMGAICDAGTLIAKKGKVSCLRCPSYTDQTGKSEHLTLEDIVTGTFAKPGSSEAILGLSGCGLGPEAAGGIALIRHGKEGWTRVWYQPGHRLSDCIKFRTIDNLQSLLCNRSVITQGVELGELVWVILNEFGLKIKPLLSWHDNIQSNPRDLVVIYPSRLFRSDFNQDGLIDVQVTFRILEHRIPPQYTGALDAINSNYRLPEAEKLRIIYLFDGQKLEVLPKSKPDVDRLKKLLHTHSKISAD